MQQVNVTLFDTARVLRRLIKRLKRQEQYFNDRLPAVLKNLTTGEQTFSSSATRRLRKYWELALNVVCNSFYELSGRQLSEAEQHRILLLSIFGPLYNDLFDEQLLDSARLESFTLAPEQHAALTPDEQLAKDIYLQLLALSPDPQRVVSHLHRVFHWQQASLQQLSTNISEQALYEITYNKSYYAFLLFYAVLDHYPDADTLAMLYQAAGLLQLTNDAFDVYKDIHDGIFTLPNLYRDFDKLRERFLEGIATFNNALARLPFPDTAKKAYSVTMHTLHAMGYLALEQLKTNTRHTCSLDELRSLSRHTLTIDMDTLQKLRCMLQVRKLANHHHTPAAPIRHNVFVFLRKSMVVH